MIYTSLGAAARTFIVRYFATLFLQIALVDSVHPLAIHVNGLGQIYKMQANWIKVMVSARTINDCLEAGRASFTSSRANVQ